MVLFNYTTRELTAKIVYYGPGLCGKTTNLQFIYDNLPGHVKKGKMLSLATKTDRTLFFDFLPIELGRIRGLRTRVQLYTVPGQVFYNSTRKLVLKGADGIVFVADSQQKMMESNVESYRNLEENLAEIGLRLEEMPLVMQFNKRDLPNLTSVEEMNTLVNRHNAPFYEAVATTGIGVEDTLKAITKRVLNHLAARYNLGAGAEASPTASPAGAGAEAIDETPAFAAPPRNAAASLELADEEPESAPEPAIPVGTPSRAGGAFPTEWPAAVEPAEAIELEMDGASGNVGSLSLEDDLQLPDPEPPVAGRPGPGVGGEEDLSDLLEELPEGGGDQGMELLDGPDEIDLAPSPIPPARTSSLESPASRNTAPRSVSLEAESRISPLDPLGFEELGEAEAPASASIDLGSVTPGRPHQVTLPLEMSVQGRTVRLQLKMTLTLTR